MLASPAARRFSVAPTSEAADRPQGRGLRRGEAVAIHLARQDRPASSALAFLAAVGSGPPQRPCPLRPSGLVIVLQVFLGAGTRQALRPQRAGAGWCPQARPCRSTHAVAITTEPVATTGPPASATAASAASAGPSGCVAKQGRVEGHRNRATGAGAAWSPWARRSSGGG